VRLTPRDLNRATLARQLLLERAPLPPVDAIRRLLALQAQEPASPYLALWNRLSGFDPAALDAAFRSFAIVKAPLMRITLHAVAAEDRAPFHDAMRGNLRAARLGDPRFRSTGLSSDEVDALVPHLLAFARRPRTKGEIETLLGERLGAPPQPGVWWALRTFAPLVHAPTAGPWSFGRIPVFTAAPGPPGPDDPAASTRRLLLRYLEAFGPASPQDFAQFALLRQPAVRPALEALADTLVELEGPDGARLYDAPGAPLPGGDVPAPPRLMAMWDSVLLAYADRSRIVPPGYRPHVVRRNGDVLPTVLVDGYVAGVWRVFDDGIEVTAFHPLPESVWDGIQGEAAALLAFLSARDEAVYGRFGHWWSTLPAAEVRVVARG
jgi:hypothetical protein